jgi:hypothetical protein
LNCIKELRAIINNLNYFSKVIICVFITTIFSLQLNAQSKNLIFNGSLEGPLNQDQIPPDGWETCGDYNNNPNIFTSYTLGDNSATINPVIDAAFVLLRVRGAHFISPYSRYTNEYLSQNLISPMRKFSCYKFTASLCTDLHMIVDDSLEQNISHPTVLRVWGGSNTCQREKLLFVSEPIKDTK